MNALAPIVASVQRRPSRVVLIAVPLLAALLGAVLAWALTNDDQPSIESAGADQTLVASGDLRATLPDDFKPARTGPKVPGFPNPGTTYVSTLSTDVAITLLPPASASLLPAQLAQARGANAPGPRPQRIGSVQAYHYVVALNAQHTIDVFAVPTTSGTATVACVTNVYELGECQTVVGALRLARGAFLPLSANAAFLERLPQAVDQLNAQRTRLRTQLAAAQTPQGSANVANRLVAAYAQAGDALRPLLPPTGDARATVRLLDSLRAEHASLATALANRDRPEFTRLAATIRRHERALAQQLATWQRSLPN